MTERERERRREFITASQWQMLARCKCEKRALIAATTNSDDTSSLTTMHTGHSADGWYSSLCLSAL